MQGGTNAQNRLSSEYQYKTKSQTINSNAETAITDCTITLPKGTNIVDVLAKTAGWPASNTDPFVLGIDSDESGSASRSWMQQDSSITSGHPGRLSLSWIIISDGTKWVRPCVWQGSGSNIEISFVIRTILVGGGIKALLGKARALLQEVLSHAGKYQCDKSKGQDSQSRRHREIDNSGRSIGRIIGHRYTVAHGTSILREERYVQQLRDDVAQFRSKLGRTIYKDHGRRNGLGHIGQVSQRNGGQSVDNLILTKGMVA